LTTLGLIYQIGATIILISVVLQMVVLYYPSLVLAMIGLLLNAISVPATVVLAYMSAREFEQERRMREVAEQRVWSDTPAGRQQAALSQLHTEMHQEPHS
jgi:hypothetical protein